MDESRTWAQSKRCIEGLPPGSPVRDVILESWDRCLRAGVHPDPEKPTFPRVPDEELQRRLQDNRDLIEIARPHMEWITDLLAPIVHVAYLVDRDGIVLVATGNAPPLMQEFGLRPGSDRSERIMGTNGAGTALAADTPVAVSGPEHFCRAFHDRASTGAPIHEPDGEVLGAMAISACAADGNPEHLKIVAHLALMIAREIALTRRNQELVSARRHQVLELLATGHPLADVLAALCRMIEEQAPGVLCSVLLVDEEGTHLHGAAAPNLPEAYTRAVDGVAIGPCAGSCGTAAYRRDVVVVDDIATDPLWDRCREPALREGLRACWSCPIIDARGAALGTFTMYYREVRRPNRDEMSVLREAAHLAGIAIERTRAERSLRDTTNLLRAITESMSAFLLSGNWREASARLLRSALDQTSSEYGFVGVVVEGPRLRVLAHEGIVWNSTVNRGFYDNAMRAYREVGFLEFTKFDNLFGKVITTGRPVLSNNPGTDPRAGGLPPGHPPLNRFLGVPIRRGTEVVGIIGVANAPRGYTGAEEAKLSILTDAAGVLYDSYRRQEREAAQEEARRLAEAERERLLEQVRGGRQRLESLSRRLMEAQEAERRHLARELHDEIGQALTGLKLGLERATRVPPDAASGVLDWMLELVEDLMGKTRQMSLDLRPSMLDDLGLLPALEWLFAQYTAQTAVRVIFEHAGIERRFNPDIETAAFRIVQEALTNVARHAGARQATVRLWANRDGLYVQVQDQGVGFEHAAIPASGHGSGLTGMHERARLLGGHLAVESAPGQGTLVTAEFPWTAVPETIQDERASRRSIRKTG